MACTCLWEDREGHCTGAVFLGEPGVWLATCGCRWLRFIAGIHSCYRYKSRRFANQKIGMMCVVIGMAEVSTCDIRVYEGQHVTKGKEGGMFISVA